MGYHSELQAAASEAQSILAQMQGMEAGAAGNFLFNGKPFVGVFGKPIVDEMPVPGGGYRRSVRLPLTVTHDQEFAPDRMKKITRIVPAPDQVYVIDSIDDHDPLVWELMLVKFGE